MENEKNIKAKEEQVNALAEKMKDASIVLLTDYRGINVEDVTKNFKASIEFSDK